MRERRGFLLAGLVFFALAASGVAGYALGTSQAPSDAEATAVRSEMRNINSQRSAAVAAGEERLRGARQGRAQGRRRGERTGQRVGHRKGRSAAIAGAEKIRQQQIANQRAAAASEPPFPPPGSVYTD